LRDARRELVRLADGVTMVFAIDAECPGTTLMTASLDQAALRGVLGRIRDLNLSVLSVARV
jgi:hypothetical protein